MFFFLDTGLVEEALPRACYLLCKMSEPQGSRMADVVRRQIKEHMKDPLNLLEREELIKLR